MFAITQPHAAYATYCHGFVGKWTFLPDLFLILLIIPLEEAIRLTIIPSLTGRDAPSDTERGILALPVHLGGLGISNPVLLSPSLNTASLNICFPLTNFKPMLYHLI